MTDTDQLREALHGPLGEFDGDRDSVIYHAAWLLLAQREAGALIITPDEETVERIAVALYNAQFPMAKFGLWEAIREEHREHFRLEAQAVLDALRDAKPDEVRITTLTADDVRLATQYEEVGRSLKPTRLPEDEGRDAMPDGET